MKQTTLAKIVSARVNHGKTAEKLTRFTCRIRHTLDPIRKYFDLLLNPKKYYDALLYSDLVTDKLEGKHISLVIDFYDQYSDRESDFEDAFHTFDKFEALGYYDIDDAIDLLGECYSLDDPQALIDAAGLVDDPEAILELAYTCEDPKKALENYDDSVDEKIEALDAIKEIIENI